jgi:hypothetical protein
MNPIDCHVGMQFRNKRGDLCEMVRFDQYRIVEVTKDPNARGNKSLVGETLTVYEDLKAWPAYSTNEEARLHWEPYDLVWEYEECPW